MKPVAQVAGVVLGTSIGASAMSVAAGAVASANGLCDPKFGCSFGVQFGALIAAGVGFVLRLVHTDLLRILLQVCHVMGRMAPFEDGISC